MPIRIFTIPFDPNAEEFPDEDLTRFLLNKRVRQTRAEFFQACGTAYWTVFVEYEVVLGEERKPDVEGLDPGQRRLYEQLRKWRKETADKEGVPVFIVADNRQLAEVAKRAPKTVKALREIRGFGEKKVSSYGKALTDMVRAFYEKEPSHEPAKNGGGKPEKSHDADESPFTPDPPKTL